MNLQQYMKLASRTYVGDKLEILTLGFMGEPGEMLDLLKKESRGKEIPREKWLEELGDCWWYAVTWCDYHKQDFIEIYRRVDIARFNQDTQTVRAHLRDMEYQGIMLDEYDERGYEGYFGEKDYSVALNHLELFLDGLVKICDQLNFEQSEIFDYNIAKLSVRYAHLLKDTE